MIKHRVSVDFIPRYLFKMCGKDVGSLNIGITRTFLFLKGFLLKQIIDAIITEKTYAC